MGGLVDPWTRYSQFRSRSHQFWSGQVVTSSCVARNGKVNWGNSEYSFKKIARLYTLLTIIEPFYARGFLTLRTTGSISLIASRLRSRPLGHNILNYAEIT